MTIAFRPLEQRDLAMLAGWLAQPHVARWWHHETTPEAVERDFGRSVRGDEPGEDLVVLVDDAPVGLLQRSFLRDYPEYRDELVGAGVEVPDGAVTLDYLIGDPGRTGHGLGARVIAAATRDTWSRHPRRHDGRRAGLDGERRVLARPREGGVRARRHGGPRAGQPGRLERARGVPARPAGRVTGGQAARTSRRPSSASAPRRESARKYFLRYPPRSISSVNRLRSPRYSPVPESSTGTSRS